MKVKTLVVVVILLIVGFLLIRDALGEKDSLNKNEIEENKVAYRYEIEDQNFTEIDQNVVEIVNTTVNVENVIDVYVIEEMRKE